ncbi:MAG: tail fiber domain-containing protein [Candidatus Binatia bacterium]
MGKKGGESKAQSSNPAWLDKAGEEIYNFAKNTIFMPNNNSGVNSSSSTFAPKVSDGQGFGMAATGNTGTSKSRNWFDKAVPLDHINPYTPTATGQILDYLKANPGAGGAAGAGANGQMNGPMSMENLRPLQGFQGQRVASLDPLFSMAEQQAVGASKSLGSDYFAPARGYVNNSTQGYGREFDPESINFEGWDQAAADKYMNPFTKTVLQQTADEMNRTAQIAKLQNSSRQVTGGSFGGSRHGVVESGLNRDLIEQTGRMMSSGMADAYQSAAQLFNTDQDRRTQTDFFNEDNRFRGHESNRQQFNTEKDRLLAAAATMGQLGTQHSNVISQDMERLSKLGALKTDQRQKEIDVRYQDFIDQRDLPFLRLDQLANLVNGSASRGSVAHVDQPNELAQGVGAAGSLIGGLGAAGFFSDAELKENIVKVGEKDGIDIVEFNYKGEPARYRGVLANQVADVRPDAVAERDGFKVVNYDAIGIPFERVGGGYAV